MPPAPLTPAEEQALTGHFGAIESSGMAAVRLLATHPMPGVFNCGAGVIDALALAWTGGKGGGSDAWTAFVREFIGEDYVPLYAELRSPGVHNLSADARIVLTSGAKDRQLHRRGIGGIYHLHTEEFARDVETAFQRFRDRTLSDPEAGRRALAWFAAKPPVRWIPFYGGAAESASATSGSTTMAGPMRPPPAKRRAPAQRSVPKSGKRGKRRR